MGRYTRPRAAARRKPAFVPVELEADLQGRLVETAQHCGWLWYHTHRSDKSPVGFMDLVLVRDGALLALECKRNLAEVAAMARSDSGKAQLDWIAAMQQVPGCRAAVVSPENEAMAMGWIMERRGDALKAAKPAVCRRCGRSGCRCGGKRGDARE